MDNKLSELSNNARKAANSFYNWSQLADCTSERVSCLRVEQLKDTSELLSALLAELEAKDKRIAELSRLLAHNIERAESAEKRLATPVRLPRPGFVTCSGERHYTYGADEVRGAIHAAGFTVEGDEQ